MTLEVAGFFELIDKIANNELTQAYLDRSFIGPQGIKLFTRAVSKNTTLSRIDITDSGFGDDGIDALLRVLHPLRNIKHLVVTGNRLGGRGIELLKKYSDEHPECLVEGIEFSRGGPSAGRMR